MELKHCKYCLKELPLSEFNSHPHTRDRLANKCKECARNYCRQRWASMPEELKQARVQRNRQLRQEKVEQYRRARRCKAFRQKYGVTLDAYEAQWLLQNRRCAICGRKRRPGEYAFSVDHCHSSGAVRGILCPQCNVDLGRIERYLADPSRVDAYLGSPPWRL